MPKRFDDTPEAVDVDHHDAQLEIGPLGQGQQAPGLAVEHQLVGQGRQGIEMRQMGQAPLLRHEMGNVPRHAADLADFPLPEESYDLIVAIFCHLPPPLRRRVFRQIPTSLRPGGMFLLEGYTPKQLEYRTGGPPDRSLLLSLDDLQDELAPLAFLHGRELVREVREGSLHNGQGAVVQVIATRK